MKTTASEWKTELEGFLPWELSMLCQSHIESWGDSPRSNGAPVPVTRPPLEQQGHRWWWKLWREAKDTRLWARSRASTSKAFMRYPPSLPVPSRWAWRLAISISTCKGCRRQVECLGKWRVNRWSGFRDGLRWGNGGSERRSNSPPSNENERELGQEPRSPGPWFHNTTSRKEHSAFGYMSTLGVLRVPCKYKMLQGGYKNVVATNNFLLWNIRSFPQVCNSLLT